MNSDIRLSTEFWDHPKTVKLERRLGLQGVKSLQMLWMWAAKHRPDGRLVGEDEEGIEIASKWQDNDRSTVVERKSTFVATLLELRWLDQDDEGVFCLHDWREHNSWAAEADTRSDKSRLSRMAKTHPDLYRELINTGKQRISREEYESLTTVERPLNERQRVLQAQGPSPSPSPSPKKEKTSSSHPEAVRLAKRLADKILETNPKAKIGNLPAWARHVDLMLRIDGRTPEEVEAVIDWCQRDAFWCSNILSTKKLREKYDQLTAKMNPRKQAKSPGGHPSWF